MRIFQHSLLALLALLAVTAVAPAQDHSSDAAPPSGRSAQAAHPARPPEAGNPGVLRLLPEDAVSDKTITLDGHPLAYTATAGTLPLFNQSGEKNAAVFYTAYVAKNAGKGRPITFVFNGGPGAASVYLNLGLAGPRIIDFGPDGRNGAAAKLVDNPDSWLAFTDLVMIDPIGTGWSRTPKPDDAKAFWSIGSDASVLAKVIALYVAKNNRADSPKYLLGESYGGFRAAKVAGTLRDEQGIIVNGIVMVSPLLEASFLWGPQHALGAALQFPALVATELDRSGKFTPEALAAAEHFAMNEYLTTLAGPPPAGDQAKAFYSRVAAMTGLPEDVVARARGNVRNVFLQHLRANGQAVSIYDATFAVPNPYPENPRRGGGSDPILDGFTRALGGAFVGYARDELGFKTDMTYVVLSHEVSSKWNWGDRRQPPSVGDDLRELLALSPSFRLLVAHGRTDLVTPYGVSRYVIDHLPDLGTGKSSVEDPDANGSTLDTRVLKRAQLKLYRGGHMFYFDPPSRRAFTADAKAFYRAGS